MSLAYSNTDTWFAVSVKALKVISRLLDLNIIYFLFSVIPMMQVVKIQICEWSYALHVLSQTKVMFLSDLPYLLE